MEAVKNDVILRLEGLGFAYDECADESLIDFCVMKTKAFIRSFCNLRENEDVPHLLHWVWVDRAAGEFLTNVKASEKMLSRLSGGLAKGVKSVKEGDTEVTFAVGSGSMTSEQRLDMLIKMLLTSGLHELIAHRRIKW